MSVYRHSRRELSVAARGKNTDTRTYKLRIYTKKSVRKTKDWKYFLRIKERKKWQKLVLYFLGVFFFLCPSKFSGIFIVRKTGLHARAIPRQTSQVVPPHPYMCFFPFKIGPSSLTNQYLIILLKIYIHIYYVCIYIYMYRTTYRITQTGD